MPKISAVIITYNEERNIERCIKSILDIVDEILIVDSFSNDRTEEICLNYNVRFLKHKFEGYLNQKNWADNQAKYDYILSLDADEELSVELKKSIQKVKENWKYDGYYFNRLTYYCGKWIRHTSWYPARKLRLWDRRKGKWDGFNPHEVFVMHKISTKKYLQGDLLHYSYYSLDEHILQINRYTDMLSKSYHKQGINASYFTILFHMFWRFIKDFLFKLGFMDGFYGLIISINSAHETFLKYVKLRKIIDDEKKLEPFRTCFYSSTATSDEEHQWIINNSKNIEDKGNESIIITNPKSKFQQIVKSAQLSFYSISLSNFSYLNPVKIILLSRFYKRQRIATVIVSNYKDLKIVALCAKLTGVKNILFYKNDLYAIPGSFINKYYFTKVVSNIIINYKKLKYPILMYNYKLFTKEKIFALDEKNIYELSKKKLLNIA